MFSMFSKDIMNNLKINDENHVDVKNILDSKDSLNNNINLIK